MLQLIFNCISVLAKDKLIRNVVLGIIILSFSVGVFLSIGASINIILSYFSGFLICLCLTKFDILNRVNFQKLLIFYETPKSSTSILTAVCSVCRKGSCNRHKISYDARHNILLDSKLNTAVEKIYNKIIAIFIASWYRDFTDDVLFLNELKTTLKHATLSIGNRLMELDICKIIMRKLLPHAIRHIHNFSLIQDSAGTNNMKFNDVVVDYLGSRLHVAATNRKNELQYLRHLASSFLPQMLSTKNVKCKNYFVLIREIITGWVLLPLVDVLADPNMINTLVVLIAVKYKSKMNFLVSSKVEFVKFLDNFAKTSLKNSKLTSDLKSILNRTDLLYAFMQFLKADGPVHILQFCLDIENFNHKLLVPDMSNDQLQNLHKEAVKLYEIYFNKNSLDYIECPPAVEHEFNQIILEGPQKIAKLQTSEALYRAYEYSFNTLETKWLPLFFRSSEFYSFLCGSKLSISYNKLSTKTKEKKLVDASTSGTVSKISSGFERIKGVLKSNQPVDGSIYLPDFQIYVDGPGEFVENIFLSNCENVFRDLSTWRVSIPSIDTIQYANSKPNHVFNINIQRIDALLENEIAQWVVSRKDQDFQLLKTKLIEFHGENEICGSLQFKRSGTSLENRRANYEEFLKLLLQKSSLKNSDLLYSFLTTNKDFTLLGTTAVPVVEDFGNIYQSVAFKFRKEKGQHLDLFMNTFLASTGNYNINKFEWAEVGKENDYITSDINVPIIPATYENEVFNNNFGIKDRNISSNAYDFPILSINTTEAIFHLMNYTFKTSTNVSKVYMGLCNVLPKCIESMTEFYINRKLHVLLSQENLTDLVTLLEEIILQSHVSSTKEERKMKKIQAFNEITSFLPYYLQEVLGSNFTNGLLHVLTVLQNPQYNKQLIYTLLDIIVCEINEDLL